MLVLGSASYFYSLWYGVARTPLSLYPVRDKSWANRYSKERVGGTSIHGSLLDPLFAPTPRFFGRSGRTALDRFDSNWLIVLSAT